MVPVVGGTRARVGEGRQWMAMLEPWPKLMADDNIEIAMETDPGAKNSNWASTTKKAWIDLVQSGREKYESVDLRNLMVYFHADVATVTGEYSQSGTKDGKTISATGLFVDTWKKKNGTWQIVSSGFP